ncbi:MAG: ATP-binding protein, partial [Alistipes sp.]|nr:ATP-binding protein [Alistipes sp.]
FAELVQGVEFGGGEQRRIEVCCPDTLQLTADRFYLYNLLSTLLDNALKYAGEEAEVTLSATAIDNGVELRVSDTGCGIAREHLPHLFDKFYRVPTGDLQPTRGYGLGLYYARRVAEMHGGTIVAQSRVGKGTTIIVTIPNHE